MVFCVECGTKLVDGAKFCLECGAKLPNSPASPAATKKALTSSASASTAAKKAPEKKNDIDLSDEFDFGLDFSSDLASSSPASTTSNSKSGAQSDAEKRRAELEEKRAAAARARERANEARARALEKRTGDSGVDDAKPTPATSSATLPSPKRQQPSPPVKSETKVDAKHDFGRTDVDLLDDLFNDDKPPVAEPKKAAPTRATSKGSLNSSGSAKTLTSSSGGGGGLSRATTSNSASIGDVDDDEEDAGSSGGINLNNVRGTTVLRIYLKKDDTYKTLGVNPTATVREVCYYYVKKMRLNTESKHFAMIEWTSGEERYMMPAEKPGQLALDWKAKNLSADEKRLYFAFSEATKKRLSKPLRTDAPAAMQRANSGSSVIKTKNGGGGGGASDISDLDALEDLFDEPKKRAPTRQNTVANLGSNETRGAPQRSQSSSSVQRDSDGRGATSAQRVGTDPFGGKLDIAAAMQKQTTLKAKAGGAASSGGGGGGGDTVRSPRALSPTPISPRSTSPPSSPAAKPNRPVGGGAARGGAAAGRGRGAAGKTNISSAADAALDDLDSFLDDFSAPAPTKKAPMRESVARADDDFDDFSAPAPTKKAPTLTASKGGAGRGRPTPSPPVKAAAAKRSDDLDEFAAEFGGNDDVVDEAPPPKKAAPKASAATAVAPSGRDGEFDDLLGDLAGQMEDINAMLDF